MVTKKILIIEDDENLSRVLIDRLNTYKEFSTRSALTGKDGLKCIESEDPDILVLDLELPDMHGFEILNRLKETNSSAKTIIISINGSESVRRTAEDMVIVKFLNKPFELAELVRIIKCNSKHMEE